MTESPDHLPEYLARLADEEAARFITDGLLSGKDSVPAIALNQAAETLPESPRRRLRAIRDLIDDAMYTYRDHKPTQVDAWLAPRLHAVLRLTRAEAADPALWNYLALGVAPDFVVWRHLRSPIRRSTPGTSKAPTTSRLSHGSGGRPNCSETGPTTNRSSLPAATRTC